MNPFQHVKQEKRLKKETETNTNEPFNETYLNHFPKYYSMNLPVFNIEKRVSLIVVNKEIKLGNREHLTTKNLNEDTLLIEDKSENQFKKVFPNDEKSRL